MGPRCSQGTNCINLKGSGGGIEQGGAAAGLGTLLGHTPGLSQVNFTLCFQRDIVCFACFIQETGSKLWLGFCRGPAALGAGREAAASECAAPDLRGAALGSFRASWLCFWMSFAKGFSALLCERKGLGEGRGVPPWGSCLPDLRPDQDTGPLNGCPMRDRVF